jgi:hypothetical protein
VRTMYVQGPTEPSAATQLSPLEPMATSLPSNISLHTEGFSVATCTTSPLPPALRLGCGAEETLFIQGWKLQMNVPFVRLWRPIATDWICRAHTHPSLAAHEANGAVFRSVALISSPATSLDIVALPHLNT